MIESRDDFERFIREIANHNVIIQLIPADDFSIHVAASKLSAGLVKDLESNKTYVLSFGHPDCSYFSSVEEFNCLIQKRLIWCFDKKSAYQLISIPNLLDINLYTHLNIGWILDLNSYETSAHKIVKRNGYRQRNLNLAIPLLKHKEMFENICDEIRSKISLSNDYDEGYAKENSIILETLAKLEKTGIHVNSDCFKNHFDARIHDGNLVYSQYNIYTSTGRPSNRFENVNYASLNKNDGSRKCFTSRWGENGKMILIDYSAFHPRIISYLIKFPIDINTDIYQYLGEMYFNRKITEYDINDIKIITMRQFYGGVEEKYQHIKYLNKAREFIEKYWFDWKKNGFINTPLFNRIITNKHLLNANPPKVLNYILQATETEIAISALKEIINYLYPYKTKAVLYTYDSILFDLYIPEKKEVLPKIIELMKIGNKFPIKIYEGDSYDSVEQIYQ